MHHFIGPRRNDIFLNQHFDPISNRLEKAERPNAIRSVTILYAAENFSFEDGYKSKDGEKNTEQSGNVNENRRQDRYPIRHP